MKTLIKAIVVLFFLNNFFIPSYANENIKYPDWANYYLGEDKYENFNRKMFIFNRILNKYAIKPVVVIWTSVIPKYGIDRINSIYNNVLYPRRLISSLIQKDFKGAGVESIRFLTNSTIGLGGMFDPSKRFFKLEQNNENMEQALASLNIKRGSYLIVPFISSTNLRGLIGKGLDSLLDPTCYTGNFITAGIKAGFIVNNISLIQPLAKTIETTFADPYEVTKKLYAMQSYILENNLDKEKVLQNKDKKFLEFKNNLALKNNIIDVNYDKKENNKAILPSNETIKGGAFRDNILYSEELIPDIILENFNPQTPVIDAMRTVLFEIGDVKNSIWAESSVWNRSFQNRIKTSSVEITKDRDKYKFRYIMQKDKNAPVAIIYPSIGEGIYSHHSIMFAKLFYDEGYSVIIQGSAFNFEFAKSMPKSFHPGIPDEDIFYLRKTTKKIVDFLEEKYNCKFKDKVVLGTSYGAMNTLFLADKENKDNLINISKFISISPPIELCYAMDVVDKNAVIGEKDLEKLKEKTAITAAKILNTYDLKENKEIKINGLPFDNNEAKIITSFIMRQKLSDLVFTLENAPLNKKSDIYKKINSMNYKDYAKKYLSNYTKDYDFSYDTSLYRISDFLETSKKYKIYHSMDDYLISLEQLKRLKRNAKNKLIIIDKGSHLGFLYRGEFIEDLKKEIALNKKSNL